MTGSLSDEISRRIAQAPELYYRLVLVIAPSGSGKTPALQEVAERTGASMINVNLELSRRLLDLSEKQRSLRVGILLGEIVAGVPGDVVLLDNTEVLFEVSLQQDPLRLLQNLSRNRTIVAAWNGTEQEGCVTYAEPGHAEYRRYELTDVLYVTADSAR
jgi:hypothetical protein